MKNKEQINFKGEFTMKAKKILTGTLIATMLISSLLTGCSKKDNSNNSSEEITTEAKATSTDTTESADKNDKIDNNTVSSVGTANVSANKKEAESSGFEASNTTNNNKPDTNQQTQTVATANNQASTNTTQNNQQTATQKPEGNKVETTEAKTTESPKNTELPNWTPDPIIVVEEPDPATEASNPDTCTSSYCRHGFTIMSSVPTDGADHGIGVCVNGTHYSKTGHTDYNNILGWNCSFCHENYYGDEWTGHAGCEEWENGGHGHSTVYGRYYTYD